MGRSRAPLRTRLLVAAVLFVGGTTTAIATAGAVDRRDERRQIFLEERADQTRRQIERRAANYIEVLHGLRGLFAVNGAVTRAEFSRFVDAERMTRRYPGTLAILFNRAVPAAAVAEFEASIRREPGSDRGFKIHPPGGSDPHVVVDYIEPPTGNVTAAGFDVTTDPVRRQAMEDARDSGLAIATAPVRLVQDPDDEPDVIIFMAVYDTPEVPATTAARRRHFHGVVGIAVRAKDLLGTLLESHGNAAEGADIEVFDVGSIERHGDAVLSGDNLVYDTRAGLDAPRDVRQARHDLSLGTRRWRVVASELGGSDHPDALAPWGIGLGGTVVTLLAAGLISSATRSRHRAERLVEERTADLSVQATALTEAHASLEQRAAELARSNTELERFAYAASHDLQEPLRMISSCVTRLEAGCGAALDERSRRYIRYAVEGAEQMGALIDDLLEYSRTGRSALQLRPVGLGDVIDRVLVSLAPTIEAHHAEVAVVGSMPVVVADETLVGQLIQNLVANACKFHESGCAPQVRISAVRYGGEWRVAVDDDGIGIDPRHRNRIFEAFRRLNSNSDYPGTGIGLAICTQIVERHGGRIWVEDSPMGGSRFVFTVPVRD